MSDKVLIVVEETVFRFRMILSAPYCGTDLLISSEKAIPDDFEFLTEAQASLGVCNRN